MEPTRTPSQPRPADQQSIIVPIMLVVLMLAFVVAIVREQVLTNKNAKTTAALKRTTKALDRSVAKLHATDKIACEFIVADATTRTNQATNSTTSLEAEKQYLARTLKVIALFDSPAAKKAAAKQTPAQRAGSNQFRDYLASGATVWSINIAAQEKNITLTQDLAATATTLAATLPCPTDTGGN